MFKDKKHNIFAPLETASKKIAVDGHNGSNVKYQNMMHTI